KGVYRLGFVANVLLLPISPRPGIRKSMSTPETPLSPEVENDLQTVLRGCDELLVQSEFAVKLQNSRNTGTPLRIKLGLDPTAPDIHLGHTVVLNKMRQ